METRESGESRVVLRPRDVQKLLGIGRNQAYHLFRRPDFPAKRLGRSWLISRAAFERWLEQRDAIDH